MGQGVDLLGGVLRLVVSERTAPPPSTPPRRVLIVKLSSIGDVVHALPVASALKRAFPSTTIDWVVEDWCATLVDGHPSVDRVIAFPRMRWSSALSARGVTALKRAVSDVRRQSYDVVLDLQGLLRSAWIARAARAPLRLARCGQREGAHLVSFGVAMPDEEVHAVDEYLQLARFLGAPTRPVHFNLPVRNEARETIDRLLASCGISPASRLVVMSPSPSQSWKAWPLERWGDVANGLADMATIAIAGTRDRQAAHAALASRLPAVIDLTGQTTLTQLVALLDRAALHVAQDSGSVHIAAALKTPVVAIYGPTSPARLGPYGQDESVVSHRELCGPGCPAYCLRQRRCLSAVTAEEVITRSRSALAVRTSRQS